MGDAPDFGGALSVSREERGRPDASSELRIVVRTGAPDAPGRRGMTVEARRVRILADMARAQADGRGGLTPLRMCEVCREATAMTGAGLMLMSEGTPLGSLGTTNSVSALIEDMQFTLGEGPSVDAYRTARPVLEPDLADPASSRWLAFAGPVVAAGARAIFAFPLVVGAVRLGALGLYADRPGSLTEDMHASALVLADVVAETILVMQAAWTTEGLGPAGEPDAGLQYVVHQAAGMVSAQLEISVGQALLRLRAHAFGNERLIAQVAADVVGRRLRFSDREG